LSRPGLVQVHDLAFRRRLDWRRRDGARGLGRGRRRPALHQVNDLIAHLRFDGAQLVLGVNVVLFAQGKEVLALHAQFSRERENANLFFLLQAEPPCSITLTYDLPRRLFRGSERNH
jgi:hypothetical protein